VGLRFRSETPPTLPDANTAGVEALASVQPVTGNIVHDPDALISDDPQGNLTSVLHSGMVQHLKMASADQRDAIIGRVRTLTTNADAFAYLKEVEQLMKEKRVRANSART
jgi:hypothetical protein